MSVEKKMSGVAEDHGDVIAGKTVKKIINRIIAIIMTFHATEKNAFITFF